jgi:uncharacterized membrane protein YeiH
VAVTAPGARIPWANLHAAIGPAAALHAASRLHAASGLHAVVGLPGGGGLTTAVDLAAVFAAAVLGGQVAAEKNLDPVGFTALAIISGLGGGIVRDVLLQHGPPLALVHPSYLITALIAAAVAFLFDLQGHPAGRVVLLLVNALGLSFWAVSGSQHATAAGLGTVSCLLLGVITAVGGGVIRDVMVGNRPSIFARNGALYATAALVAAGADQALTAVHLAQYAVTLISIVLGSGIHLLSLRYEWNLPASRPDLPAMVKAGVAALRAHRNQPRA